MITRRQLLLAGGVSGAAFLLRPQTAGAASARVLRSRLDANNIPKYRANLTIPGAMPRTADGLDYDEYVIGLRQFRQQILPSGLPDTTVWGYGALAQPATFAYPSCTLNALVDRPVRITWINQLVDERGDFRPHLFAVDPTLHWANPPGGLAGRDAKPSFRSTPDRYTGPVPMVVHLHGAHTTEESDGYPDAWYLPDARNIPDGFARVGSFYDQFRRTFADRHAVDWPAGAATFQYPNDQSATTEWFHDHSLGLTRVNVYAGPAGFYLLRGGSTDLPTGVLPGPAPAEGDPPGTRYHEVPLLIQDRSFHQDGSLFYPSERQYFKGYDGPFIPTTDVPPYWSPDFVADSIVVNGRTWPVFPVEARRYRLRLLNGCNSRFLILSIAANPTARPAKPALPIWLIGTDGGFLPAPVRLEQVQLGNAQRVDTIVDFTDVPVGTELYLVNEGPDYPYAGGRPGTDFEPANPRTTGQVMKFVVGPRVGSDESVPPDELRLPTFVPLGEATRTRRLSLNHTMSATTDAGPVAALLGTVDAAGARVPLRWHDPITEDPAAGTTEIWEFHNHTMEAHPMHVHDVQFQVIGRGANGQQPPTPAESGYLDTVMALPDEVTRIKVHFDQPGRFVWHCQIVEHEDNEMMRPFQILPKGAPPTGDGGSQGVNVALAAAGVTALSAAVIAAANAARKDSPQSTDAG